MNTPEAIARIERELNTPNPEATSKGPIETIKDTVIKATRISHHKAVMEKAVTSGIPPKGLIPVSSQISIWPAQWS